MSSILALVSNTADGVCGVDLRQRVVLWNGAAAEMMGFEADEVLGRPCFKIFGGRSDSGARICTPMCRQMAAALDQNPPPLFELRSHTKSGVCVWLSVSTIVVPSRWSDLSVLIHVFREISHQKEMVALARQLVAMVSRWTTCLEHKDSTPPPTLHAIGLTRREAQVLKLLGAGGSTARIADQLAIRPATARVHIRKILSKLGVHSRLEAVTLAIRNGLI